MKTENESKTTKPNSNDGRTEDTIREHPHLTYAGRIKPEPIGGILGIRKLPITMVRVEKTRQSSSLYCHHIGCSLINGRPPLKESQPPLGFSRFEDTPDRPQEPVCPICNE